MEQRRTGRLGLAGAGTGRPDLGWRESALERRGIELAPNETGLTDVPRLHAAKPTKASSWWMKSDAWYP